MPDPDPRVFPGAALSHHEGPGAASPSRPRRDSRVNDRATTVAPPSRCRGAATSTPPPLLRSSHHRRSVALLSRHRWSTSPSRHYHAPPSRVMTATPHDVSRFDGASTSAPFSASIVIDSCPLLLLPKFSRPLGSCRS